MSEEDKLFAWTCCIFVCVVFLSPVLAAVIGISHSEWSKVARCDRCLEKYAPADCVAFCGTK